LAPALALHEQRRPRDLTPAEVLGDDHDVQEAEVVDHVAVVAGPDAVGEPLRGDRDGEDGFVGDEVRRVGEAVEAEPHRGRPVGGDDGGEEHWRRLGDAEDAPRRHVHRRRHDRGTAMGRGRADRRVGRHAVDVSRPRLALRRWAPPVGGTLRRLVQLRAEGANGHAVLRRTAADRLERTRRSRIAEDRQQSAERRRSVGVRYGRHRRGRRRRASVDNAGGDSSPIRRQLLVTARHPTLAHRARADENERSDDQASDAVRPTRDPPHAPVADERRRVVDVVEDGLELVIVAPHAAASRCRCPRYDTVHRQRVPG
jgi:hypothetical protein